MINDNALADVDEHDDYTRAVYEKVTTRNLEE